MLLGGPEDQADHALLSERLGGLVETTPVDQGLEVGAAQVDRCDVVVTGDSLGMHMAIALEKHVVAWFGPTSPQEIDLYDRGIKLLADVGCAPCWKPECDQQLPCNTVLPADLIGRAVSDCLAARTSGSSVDEVRGGSWWSGA